MPSSCCTCRLGTKIQIPPPIPGNVEAEPVLLICVEGGGGLKGTLIIRGRSKRKIFKHLQATSTPCITVKAEICSRRTNLTTKSPQICTGSGEANFCSLTKHSGLCHLNPEKCNVVLTDVRQSLSSYPSCHTGSEGLGEEILTIKYHKRRYHIDQSEHSCYLA
jgi:hypothetical protein